MAYRRYANPKYLLFLPLLLVLMIAVACGDDATPVVIEKEVIVGKEVIKEVPVDVIKEVILIATPTPTPEAMMEKREGGIFTAANRGSMNGMDPILSSLPANIRWAAPMYSRLLTLDKDANILPLLATSWTVSDDLKVYTFNIKDDVKFHDGQPLTSEDVVYTWDVMINPPEGVPSLRQSLFDAVIDKIEAPDPTTVKITTKIIVGWFLGHVPIVGILPKHAHQPVAAEGGFSATGMGSGPFKFVEFKPKVLMVLEANPDYYEGIPPLDGIEWPFIFESEAVIAAMITGRLMHFGSNPANSEEIDAIRGGRPDIQIFRAARGISRGIGFNHQNEFLAKKPIREALVLALVEEDIIKVGYPGAVLPGTFFPGRSGIPESEWNDYAMYGFGLSRDERLAKAKEILEAEGATDLKFLWVTRAKSGHAKAAEAGQDLLKRIGVEIEIQAFADQASLNKFVQSQPFDIVTSWVIITPFGEAEHYLSNGWASTAKDFAHAGRRPAGYTNPLIDELLAELRTELDVDKRAAITQKADRILLNDMPSKQMGFLLIQDVLNGRVRGLRAAQLADPIWMLRKVSLAAE